MERNQIPYFSDNGDTKTNPYNIPNIFNNSFASIAETTNEKV